MIYVPDTSYECYVVQSENVIRAYEQVPHANSTINYRDYYIHSDYMYKDSSQQFNQYSSLPVCLDNSILTNDFYYRVDFYSILIIFIVLFFFCIYLPFKLFMKLFKKGAL